MINITPLSSTSLPLPFPDSMEFAGGFNLELGDTPLNIPVQLAIPAPVGVPIGTEVLFMRKGSLPGEADTWNDTWLIQESGIVGADGYIRTTSPPFPGVTESGTYTIGLLPAGMPSVSSIVKASTEANAGIINLSTNLNFENSYLGAQTGGIGAVAATENQFEATTSLLAYLAQSSNQPLSVIGIPKVGEIVVTEAQVQLNTQGVPTISAVLNGPDTGLAIPLEPPSLESVNLEFSNNEPVVFLTGSNFLNGLNGNLGASFGDLKVDFWVGGKNYSGTVVPGLSSSLGENRYKVAVKAPISVPLGESEIVLSRPQKERFGPGPLDSSEVKRSSFEDLQLEPVFSDLILVAKRSSDKIKVIDALSSVPTPPNQQQKPPVDISVGIPGTTGTTLDRPGQLAVTSNATRAYVPLERSGRVAMVDLLARREVDADASTTAVDDINLPPGASPGAMSIDPWDNYGYIADSKRGSIYILDVNPDSANYHQVVKTISVDATSGLRQIAINSDGRKLFATGANGSIYAINIDPDDESSVPNSNPRKWRELIGKVATPTGAFGLSATPDPDKMVFTNGSTLTDGSGFGVLTVNDDPLNWTPTTTYANLTLGSDSDIFDVNEGVAVTVTADGKYAFVAGSSYTRSNQFNADPREGGNIGIIEDPLGPNPKLVAATQQMPDNFTNNVALSSDGKYLIASNPLLNGGGDTYIYNVPEIDKTVKNSGGKDLTKVAIDVANPNVIYKSFDTGGNPLGLVVAQKPPSFKEQIEKLLKAGAIANYDRLIALIIKTNDQNDLKSVVGDATMRTLIVDSFSSKPEMATVVMATLLKSEQKWENPPNSDFFKNYATTRHTGILPPLSYSASMNCWEMILYAAALCGYVSLSQISDFYEKSTRLIFLGLGGVKYDVWPLLGYPSQDLKFYRGRESNSQGGGIIPKPGQLLFFVDKIGEDPTHIALSLGGDKAVSLWNQPNKIDSIQIINVDQLKGYVQVGQPLTEVMKKWQF